MADSKNPLEYFQRYFTVRHAVTRRDREETYRIRYRVYCEEFGYEPADRFPDKMERDEMDDHSSHCLIMHASTNLPAGCVRICPATVNGAPSPLPFENCCSAGLFPGVAAWMADKRPYICEASRFAVDTAFRRRSGESLTRFGEIASLDLSDMERRTFPLVSLALVLTGSVIAEAMGRRHIFGVMEPFLPRLLKRSGLAFDRKGGDLNHHGIRAVYLTDIEEFIPSMQGSLAELYKWIRVELNASAQSAPPVQTPTPPSDNRGSPASARRLAYG